MKITTVIIARNEEHRIGDCIRSVLSCSDEVLVLDSFSTDGTVPLAESLGARVFCHEFEGYGASKNRANAMAAGDWILSLDADERLDQELRNAILKVKSEGTRGKAFRIQRLNNYCGQWIRHGAWNPDRKIRLWEKGMAEWNLSEVHEELVLVPGVEVVDLPGKILHFSYASKEEHLAKIRRYAERGALQWKKSGKNPGILKQVFSPASRWFRDYVLKAGFLDGRAGLQIANYSAYEVWLKYHPTRQKER